MRIKAAFALATSLAALLITAGCSSDDADPKVLPTLSPTASTTPSSAPVEVPVAARARTPQGADAFVHFFFYEMNEAFKTSDGDRIRRLTNGECETCENYARSLDEGRKRGEHLEGESFVVTAVAAPPLQLKGVIVDVAGRLPSTKVVDERGQTLRTLPAEGFFKFEVAAKWIDGAWRVSGIRKNPK